MVKITELQNLFGETRSSQNAQQKISVPFFFLFSSQQADFFVIVFVPLYIYNGIQKHTL